jgi:hypothetical protein
MVPVEYGNFLVASTGASAALLGLLFVSISIAPERVFGESAQPGQRSLALSSFTALANAFFISLSGLIPHVPFGVFVIIAAGIALSQSLSLLRFAREWRNEGRLVRGIALFVAGLAIYSSEVYIGIAIYRGGVTTALATALLQLLLAVFAIGLVRAWELLGAPHGRGIASGALEWVETRIERRSSAAEPPGRP